MKLIDVAVVVKDAKASATWWKQKVGLEIRDNEDHWVTVAPKGANVEIHLCQGPPAESGNTGIGFTTDNCRAEEARLRKAGVTITKPTTKSEWGTHLMFADPDGNEYWLTETPEAAAPTKKATAKAAAKKPARKATAKKTATKRASAKKATAKKAAAKKR